MWLNVAHFGAHVTYEWRQSPAHVQFVFLASAAELLLKRYGPIYKQQSHWLYSHNLSSQQTSSKRLRWPLTTCHPSSEFCTGLRLHTASCDIAATFLHMKGCFHSKTTWRLISPKNKLIFVLTCCPPRFLYFYPCPHVNLYKYVFLQSIFAGDPSGTRPVFLLF